MKRVSKGFFLGSVAIGLGIGLVFAIIGTIQSLGGDPYALYNAMSIGGIPIVYAAIVNMVLWHKMWAAIRDGPGRMTPGMAVWLLFIPLFNFYWIFQVLWGFSKDYNAYIKRHDVRSDKLPEGLFLVASCILTFTLACTVSRPILGLILVTIAFFIMVVLVSLICDAINAIPPATTSQPCTNDGQSNHGPNRTAAPRGRGTRSS